MIKIRSGAVLFTCASLAPLTPLAAQEASPQSAPLPVRPSIELTIASEGMSKGLRQTDGPQAIVRPQLVRGKFYAGAQIKNVDSPVADGEAAAFLGAKAKLLGFSLDGSLSYKFLVPAEAGAVDTGALELIAVLGRDLGPVAAKIALTYSPDDFGATGRSAYVFASGAVDLTGSTSLGGGIGRRERDNGADYTGFNLGLTQNLGKHFSADLRYHDTAEGNFGETYRSRVVASLKARF